MQMDHQFEEQLSFFLNLMIILPLQSPVFERITKITLRSSKERCIEKPCELIFQKLFIWLLKKFVNFARNWCSDKLTLYFIRSSPNSLETLPKTTPDAVLEILDRTEHCRLVAVFFKLSNRYVTSYLDYINDFYIAERNPNWNVMNMIGPSPGIKQAQLYTLSQKWLQLIFPKFSGDIVYRMTYFDVFEKIQIFISFSVVKSNALTI